MRKISEFRRDLLIKQTTLNALVTDSAKEYEEIYEESSVKNEITTQVEVKEEPDTVEDDYHMFISTEYLETLQENGTLQEDPQYAEEKYEYTERLVKSRILKKHYKRAQCGLCGNFYYKDQLQRHIDKVHYKVKRFFCDVCGFGAFLKCNLATHMAKHVAKEYREQIHCSLCSATFTRHESLKNHHKTEHEANPEMMRCFCGKEFNLRHKLTTHIKRTHNNTRDHACGSCPRRFFTPKELKLHTLKSHTPG